MAGRLVELTRAGLRPGSGLTYGRQGLAVRVVRSSPSGAAAGPTWTLSSAELSERRSRSPAIGSWILDNLTHSLLGAALGRGRAAARGTGPTSADSSWLSGVLAATTFPTSTCSTPGSRRRPSATSSTIAATRTRSWGLPCRRPRWALVCWLLPAVRRLSPAHRARLWTLISAALLSHELLDAGNSYGVHPFFPFDSRWYYGDAVFILEPWLLAPPRQCRRRGWHRVCGRRLALLGFLAILPLGLYRAGWCTRAPSPALFAAGLVFGWALSRLSPRGASLDRDRGQRRVRGRPVRPLLLRTRANEGAPRHRPSAARSSTSFSRPIPATRCAGPSSSSRGTPGRGSTCCTRDAVPGSTWLAPTRCASHRYGGPRPYQRRSGGWPSTTPSASRWKACAHSTTGTAG